MERTAFGNEGSCFYRGGRSRGPHRTMADLARLSPVGLFTDTTCCSRFSKLTKDPFTFPAPKVCEACKTKNEDDNDIMETLCKNDFGK